MSTWRLMWRLIRFRTDLYLVSALSASLMFYLFPLVPGLVARAIFDDLTGHAPARFGIWGLIALLVGAGAGRLGAFVGAGVAEITAGQTAAALMQRNLLERVLHRPGARAVPSSPGEAISRFRDDVDAIMRFMTWTVDPVGQTIVMCIALVILFRINPLFTLAVFLPLAVVLAVVNRANKRIRRYRKASQEGIGEVTNFLGEIFGAVLAVKVAGAEDRVIGHFQTLNDARRRATVNDLLFTQLLQSVSFNAGNLGTGVLLLFVGGSMRSGSFTVGDFALFVSYLGWLTTVTGMFGNFLAMYRQTGVSFDRLGVLLQEPSPAAAVEHNPVYLRGTFPEVPYRPKLPEHRLDLLEARGLTFRYPDSGRGIEDVDLHVERGSFTVLTGRIGAGKTTLLRTLLGLLPMEAGEIRWNGEKVLDPAGFLVPPRVAYTSQVPRLFSETLRDNILLGLPPDRVDLDRAVREAILDRDLAEMDAGMDTMIGSRGVRLSGGQAQRTAAARMLVREPELLVFDDLSSALDVETEQQLWEQLAGRPEATCLVVSHRRPALRRADTIVLLMDGRVASVGRLEELLEMSEEMRRLWHGEGEG